MVVPGHTSCKASPSQEPTPSWPAPLHLMQYQGIRQHLQLARTHLGYCKCCLRDHVWKAGRDGGVMLAFLHSESTEKLYTSNVEHSFIIAFRIEHLLPPGKVT